jgi:hypothetical protein
LNLAFFKKIRSIPLFGWSHSFAPAYANIGRPRTGAVKNGRSFSGHPEGLFLTAASTAASSSRRGNAAAIVPSGAQLYCPS